MGYLSGSTVYLIGSIENDNSYFDWRKKITELLKPLGIIVYNPLIKPKWFIDKYGDITAEQQNKDREELSQILDNFKERYTSSRYEKFEDALNRNTILRKTCLKLVSMSDFIIYCITKSPTVGSHEEVNLANQQHKPILFFNLNFDDTIDSCWRICQFYKDYQFYYRNMISLIDFLKYIDSDPSKLDPIEWMFLKGRAWNESTTY
jgi:hypothetical protein